MNALYDFIVKPVGEKYNNTIKVGDKDLVVNTKIENWKFVNRIAEVIQTPLELDTGVKVGDKVIFKKYSPDEVTVDGEELLIISEEDVLAIIE